MNQAAQPVALMDRLTAEDGGMVASAVAPRLSVIVVTWNERDDLARCLAALEAHPVDGILEAIVIDNGSTDGTAELVAERFPDVLYIRNETNRGPGVARNQGLEMARGTYVAFLDSDAYVHPDALETVCAFLDENPAVGMVGPKLVYEDGRLQLSCRRVPTLTALVANRATNIRWLREHPDRRAHLMWDESHDRTMDVEYVLGATMVVRGATLEEVGHFDDRAPFAGFLNDADLALRFWHAGWRVTYLPEATVTHGYRRRTVNRPLSAHTAHILLSYALLRIKLRRMEPPAIELTLQPA
jgi:GT2 family glycosyltransferase